MTSSRANSRLLLLDDRLPTRLQSACHKPEHDSPEAVITSGNAKDLRFLGCKTLKFEELVRVQVPQT